MAAVIERGWIRTAPRMTRETGTCAAADPNSPAGHPYAQQPKQGADT